MSRRLALAAAGILFFWAGCYVAPSTTAPASSNPCTDVDGDSYCADIDCNDRDPAIYPGAPDNPGDGLDQNCDGYY